MAFENITLVELNVDGARVGSGRRNEEPAAPATKPAASSTTSSREDAADAVEHVDDRASTGRSRVVPLFVALSAVVGVGLVLRRIRGRNDGHEEIEIEEPPVEDPVSQ
jgi:hypothetical protein